MLSDWIVRKTSEDRKGRLEPRKTIKKENVRILVVEDEQKVARALQEGLEAESYDVAVAHTGEEGFFLANAQPFELIVLDCLLPGRDGIEILTTLRRRG